MLLDNVVIPGSDLLNGDFQTHTLAAWDVGGAGSVGAQMETGTVIPLPAGVWVGLVMFGCLAGAAIRRRSCKA